MKDKIQRYFEIELEIEIQRIKSVNMDTLEKRLELLKEKHSLKQEILEELDGQA